MKQWQWIALLAGGAVVAVGGVLLLEKKSTASPTPTPTPLPGSMPAPYVPPSSGPPTVVLSPGTLHIQNVLATGYYAALPTGQKAAKWLTQNGNDARMVVEVPIFVQPAPSSQPIAPQTFTYIDPNDGSVQTSVVFVDS